MNSRQAVDNSARCGRLMGVWVWVCALALCVAGCSATREVLERQEFSKKVMMTSSPPGVGVFVNNNLAGPTPGEAQINYSHVKERITPSGRRTGLFLLVSGLAGLAVAGGMVAGGVLSDTPSVAGLGAAGGAYGLTGVIWGAIAMAYNPPWTGEHTEPGQITFGVQRADGTQRVLRVVPLNDRERHINFAEIDRVHFDGTSGRWQIQGLRTLRTVAGR